MNEAANPRLLSRLSAIGWILLIASFVRVLYLSAYVTQLPFAFGPLGDSFVYLQQARNVRAGELGSPALIAFSPLYGYVLALFTSGRPSLLPILMQLAAGVLNLWLTYHLARSLFGKPAAIVSATLMLGYGTLLFLESKLLTETLALTLLLLGMRAYLSPGFRQARAWTCVAAGLLLALAVLMRASMLFCVPLLVVFATLPWALNDNPLGVRFKRAGLCAVGALLIFGANGSINLRYAGVFVPVIMVSRTLETVSKVEWKGSFDAFSHDGRQASPLDVVEQAEARLRGEAPQEPSLLERVASIDVGALLASLPKKWSQTFSNRETFQEYGFLGERSTISILKWHPVSFGTIAILAAFGCWVLFREGRARELLPLLPVILGTLVTTGLYHPSSRYRLAMVIPLLLLAGIGAVGTYEAARSRRAWLPMTLMVIGVAATTTAWFSMGRGNRPAWHLELAVSSYEAGEYEAAVAQADTALSLAPTTSPVGRRAVKVREMAVSAARRESAKRGR